MAKEYSGAVTKRAQDHIATLAMSIAHIRGLPAPSRDELGNIVARMTPELNGDKLSDPRQMTLATIGQLDGLVTSLVDPKQKQPTNLYSAEGARAEQPGKHKPSQRSGIETSRFDPNPLSLQRMQEAAAESINATDRSTSGARYDGIGSASDWSSPAGLAKMRDYAIQSGLPWAANNPELLRLGPTAVAALADVHFKQETYKLLTTDASFKAKDVVTLARFAKQQHVDANKLGGDLSNAEKPLSQQERERLNGAVVPYMADSKNPTKRDTAVKAFESAAQAHPEDRPALEKAKEDLHLKGEKLKRENEAAVKKDSRAGSEANRASGKEAKANDKLAALDGLASVPEVKPAVTSNGEKPKSSPEPAKPQSAKAPPKTAAPAPHKLG